MPLIITHGWPGSVVEFHKVIEPLTDPTAHGGNAADAFHVVCPSLPGFGFSAKPTTTGWGVDRIASAWAVLMDRLGYCALRRAGRRLGFGGHDRARRAGRRSLRRHSHHARDVGAAQCRGDSRRRRRRGRSQGIKYYADWDSGYSKQQSTRPQTLGYGLTGLAERAGGVDPGKILGLDRLRRASRKTSSAATNCSTMSCCIG